jgi:SnoaL-like domain
MTDVVDRLAAAMNAHDLNVVAGLIHPDYRSEQPAHPGRAFTGRAQMLANWEAMLAGIPDFCAEICRSVHDGDTTWTNGAGQAPAATVSVPKISSAQVRGAVGRGRCSGFRRGCGWFSPPRPRLPRDHDRLCFCDWSTSA